MQIWLGLWHSLLHTLVTKKTRQITFSLHVICTPYNSPNKQHTTTQGDRTMRTKLPRTVTLLNVDWTLQLRAANEMLRQHCKQLKITNLHAKHFTQTATSIYHRHQGICWQWLNIFYAGLAYLDEYWIGLRKLTTVLCSNQAINI